MIPIRNFFLTLIAFFVAVACVLFPLPNKKAQFFLHKVLMGPNRLVVLHPVFMA